MSAASGSQSRFWDFYSLSYDAIRFSIPYQRHLAQLRDALALSNGLRVLDLGCATGNLECVVSESSSVEVVGLDYSAAMLARASAKCAGRPNVSFVRADLRERLPFDDGSFDRVVANNVLYAMEDKEAVLAEAARVLAPGGTLVLSDPRPEGSLKRVVRAHFVALAELPLGRRLTGYAKTMVMLPLAGIAPMLLSTAVIGKRREKGEYAFSDAEELERLLSASFPALTIARAYADQSWLAVAVKPVATRIA